MRTHPHTHTHTTNLMRMTIQPVLETASMMRVSQRLVSMGSRRVVSQVWLHSVMGWNDEVCEVISVSYSIASVIDSSIVVEIVQVDSVVWSVVSCV